MLFGVEIFVGYCYFSFIVLYFLLGSFNRNNGCCWEIRLFSASMMTFTLKSFSIRVSEAGVLCGYAFGFRLEFAKLLSYGVNSCVIKELHT